jgi:hypothetical protein
MTSILPALYHALYHRFEKDMVEAKYNGAERSEKGCCSTPSRTRVGLWVTPCFYLDVWPLYTLRPQ